MLRLRAARSVGVESDSGYVNSRWAFLAVLNFELNVLTFSQSFEAITLDSGEVYEHVFAAISRTSLLKMPHINRTVPRLTQNVLSHTT